MLEKKPTTNKINGKSNSFMKIWSSRPERPSFLNLSYVFIDQKISRANNIHRGPKK